MFRSRDVVIVLLLGIAAGGCSHSERGTPPGGEAPRTAAFPLGVGYPDPMGIIGRLGRAMEAGNWPAACEDLADLGRQGTPVPLVPGVNVPADFPPDAKDRMKPFFRHLRGLERSWVKVSYGSVQNRRNAPPMVTIPIRWRYDFSQVPPEEREALLHVVNKQGTQWDWDQLVASLDDEVRERERSGNWPTWTFVWLGDRWRLYLGSDEPGA